MSSPQRALKVGIQLPEVERPVGWSELLAMTRLAEQAGFDSIWLGDHLLYRVEGEPDRAPFEAWALLAALAGATERIALGPLVACTGFHNPAVLAKAAETVDEISGGRLILGLGAGWNRAEFEAFGVSYDRRVDRFEEAFTIIRSLLRDGRVDFAGAYHQARDCVLVPRGPRPNGLPLMVGSLGERMLRITLPYVEMWNVWYADFDNRVDGLKPLLARVDSACRDVDRDPATLARTAALLVQLPGGTGRKGGDPGERAIPPIAGTSEDIARELRAFAAAGISHVQLVLDPITLESIEALAPVLALVN